MKVLCLDSSRQSQSASLYDLANSQLLATNLVVEYDPKLQKNNRQQKSSQYLPLLMDLLDGLALKPKDIDLIAIVTGPGSFTGVRTALVIAKTLASELALKILPVNNFELLRYKYKLTAKQEVLLSAGKTGYFISKDSNYSEPETNYFASADELLANDDQTMTLDDNLSELLTEYCQDKFKKLGENAFLDLFQDQASVEAYYLREPSLGVVHKKKS